jgi:hypothetical protein
MGSLRSIGCSLAVAALAAGCGGGAKDDAPQEPPPPQQACTQIGCADGVTVRVRGDVRRAKVARACVGGRCSRWRLRRGRIARIPIAVPEPGDRVRVTVRLLDADGVRLVRARTRARLTATRPNGPDCPPVCYSARVVLDAEQGRLRQVA